MPRRSGTFAAVACICIAVYVIGLPGFEAYYLMRNRKNLHRENCLDPKKQRRIEKSLVLYMHIIDQRLTTLMLWTCSVD